MTLHEELHNDSVGAANDVAAERKAALKAAGFETIETFKELRKVAFKKKIDPVKLNAIIHAIKLMGLEPAQDHNVNVKDTTEYSDTELAMRLNRLISVVTKNG